MKIVRFVPQVLLISLLLALTGIVGLGLAQAPELLEQGQPQGEVSIDAVVNSEISYQGVLKESGSPVTGARRFTTGTGCTWPITSMFRVISACARIATS